MKNLLRLVGPELDRPMLIQPAALFAAGAAMDDTDEDDCEDMYSLSDGVAVVRINGVILAGVPAWAKKMGLNLTDTEDLAVALEWAGSEPSARGVVLDIDSPGGTVTGVPEVADQVLDLAKTKPVIAHTRGQMSSGAYWIGSQASAVYATGSAMLGSVGVYLAVLDQSEAYRQAGFKVDVLTGGTLKGIGLPGTALTQAQREHLQERVTALHDRFKTAVRGRRGDIGDEHLQGQEFFGTDAVRVGLADSVATLAEAIRDVKTLAGIKQQ